MLYLYSSMKLQEKLLLSLCAYVVLTGTGGNVVRCGLHQPKELAPAKMFSVYFSACRTDCLPEVTVFSSNSELEPSLFSSNNLLYHHFSQNQNIPLWKLCMAENPQLSNVWSLSGGFSSTSTSKLVERNWATAESLTLTHSPPTGDQSMEFRH